MHPRPPLPDPEGGILWPPLVSGTLLSRYKRFLADVRLAGGETVTAHCPNTGRMTGCAHPGCPVYVSRHPGAGRKLGYTLELTEMPTSLVGVNTQVPNRLVAAAVAAGRVPELAGFDAIRREVPAGGDSRIDLLLQKDGGGGCYVEIKNCTLVEDGIARFPDAVTLRGKKHLEALAGRVAAGSRGVIFYLIQRMDARAFQPADDIDPAYGDALRRAAGAGVEVLAYDVRIDLAAIRLAGRVACRL